MTTRPFVHDLMVLAAALAISGALVTGSQAQQSQTDSTATQSQLTIAADAVQGAKVFDTQGKQVGSISKLMLDPADGKVSSVLIKRSGTAGMGSSEMTVPWDALKVQRGDKNQVIVTLQRDMLEKAPAASPSTDHDQKGKRQK